MHGDEGGNAFAFEVLTTDQVAGAFRGDHDDVDVGRRGDGFEVDSKPVAEEQGFAGGQVRGDVCLINFRNDGVWHGDHDDVGLFDSFCGVEHFETAFCGDGAAFGLWVETDDDLEAAFLEVQRVGVAL